MVTRWPPLVLLTVSCKLSAELRCKLRYQDVCQGNLALITFPSGSVARPWLLYTSYLFQNQQSLWRPLILRCTVPLCCPVKTILQKNLTRIKKLFLSFSGAVFHKSKYCTHSEHPIVVKCTARCLMKQTSSEYRYLTDITLISNCLYGRVYWAPHQILNKSYKPWFVSTLSFLKQNLQVIHHNTPPLGLEPCYTCMA